MRVLTTKTLINYDLATNFKVYVEKIKNLREQNFEGKGNNMQSDEEGTQGKHHE